MRVYLEITRVISKINSLFPVNIASQQLLQKQARAKRDVFTTTTSATGRN